MPIGRNVGKFAVEHTRLIAVIIVGVTLILGVVAALPSLWPHRFEFLHSLKIDTDPENMLPKDEPVRVFHDRMKKLMSLNDMIVVGIVNEKEPEYGVFTPESLQKIYALTQFARGLQWRDPDDPSRRQGVVETDMIAPSMVDNVESGGAGVVRFEWLMPKPPETQAQALEVRRKALNLPFLKGTLVSEDGKALALYLPISTKDVSFQIYNAIEQKLDNPSRLFPSEIGNFNDVLHQLAAAEQKKGDHLIQRIWQVLSPDTRRRLIGTEKNIEQWINTLSRLDRLSGNNAASGDLGKIKDTARRLLRERQSSLEALTADLNAWMKKPLSGPWLHPDKVSLNLLAPEGRRLLENKPDLDKKQIFRLKRLWVEAAFPDRIIPSRVAELKGEETYHITGLPVAEDTFGVQMFKQMAVSAPIAMAVIFLLMWFFFRSVVVILPAMYDALIATVATMSLLVITGNTIHIMSSMIPIFVVPIAVLDDVHVISEFFDRYQKTRNRKQTIIDLMGDLFTPMLYTTLTTAVGFASLALAPIPPVQVFGLFVAFGMIVAWLCSVLLVPAFISALPDKVLQNFGAKHGSSEEEEHLTILGRILRATGHGTYRYAKPIIALSMAALVISVYGISRIRVNDNPTKWFEKGHPIRIADGVLNDHFGGTYMAYLGFRPKGRPLPPVKKTETQNKSEEKRSADNFASPPLPGGLEKQDQREEEAPALPEGINQDVDSGNPDEPDHPDGLVGSSSLSSETAPSLPKGLGGNPEKTVEETTKKTETHSKQEEQIFKDPSTLRWIGALQAYMSEELGMFVGKSNSVTDIVETVHRELMVGVERNGRVLTRKEAMRVPDSRGGVAQSLLQFQNSHRPQDLWHFVTPDYRTAVIWLQLTSGDNRDMNAVAGGVNDWLDFWQAGHSRAAAMVKKEPERFQPVLRSMAGYVLKSKREFQEMNEMISVSPVRATGVLKKKASAFSPAVKLQHDWFGLTYINVVWQEKMVKGMLKALLGSFLAVFLMMTLLYRSAMWGILCMMPLTVTIAMIYGLIGLIGKEYDMPVAVLSALSLGLAVDYAIHFLTRSRMMYLEYGSWQKTAGPVFGEPARAISRNAIVVGIGFLPLLLAPLVPYQTVGIFIAAILLLAGAATMLILPAAITLLEDRLFPRTRRACTLCHRGTCIISAVAAAALAVFNLQEFFKVGWTTLTWISLPVIALLAGWCAWWSRGEKEKTEAFAPEKDEDRK